ncbi:hypothetical protein [Moraxella lacunata]|uniref:hypothetical protein n=1 Tax=Moraxella lacunata TaxID=477 RepID=UPI003EE2CBBE
MASTTSSADKSGMVPIFSSLKGLNTSMVLADLADCHVLLMSACSWNNVGLDNFIKTPIGGHAVHGSYTIIFISLISQTPPYKIVPFYQGQADTPVMMTADGAE